MDNDSGQTLARQWAMLRAIPRAPHKTTTGDIAHKLADEGFQVSRRTVERDLQGLVNLFPLVLDDRTKPYGWSWARDASSEFMPRLSTSQAVAILLAKSHLQHLLPVGMNKDLVPVFDAAGKALASSGWRDWHKRTAVVPASLPLIPPKVSLKVMEVVQQALARRRCIEADYRTKGAAEVKRWKIHPLGLIVRGPVLYLVCRLFDYEDVLQLALHRLGAAVELPEATKDPEGFDINAYLAGPGGRVLPTGTIRLVCRFHAPAAEHLLESPLSTDQTWTAIADGQVEVAATVMDDEQLRWWLLAFGSQVLVIEPDALRVWMVGELEMARQRYIPRSKGSHSSKSRGIGL